MMGGVNLRVDRGDDVSLCTGQVKSLALLYGRIENLRKSGGYDDS